MPILAYDIIVVALLALCSYSGYKKGFFLTLCGLLATFVAFFGALFLANTLAAPVADAFTPMITPMVEEMIQEQLSDVVDSQTAALMDSLDSDVLDYLDGSLMEDLMEGLQDHEVLSGFTDDLTVDASGSLSDAINSLVSSLVYNVARIILFLIGFFVLLAVWNIISHSLNLAFKLPLISTANQVAGLGLGFVKGLIFAFIFALVAKYCLLSQSEIDTTFTLGLLLDHSPLSMFQDFTVTLLG